MLSTKTTSLILIASTILAFAPMGAAESAPYVATVCSEETGSCAHAFVSYHIVPGEDGSPCVYVSGTGEATTYDCTIEWTLQLVVEGTSCGWAYMEPTGEVLNCVLLTVGIALPREAIGSETYRVTVGTRNVYEDLWVCIDYGTPFEECDPSPYRVPATLPALDPHVAEGLPPVGVIVDSILETAEEYVEWASGDA